jgi:DNA mismatch repair protein MutS
MSLVAEYFEKCKNLEKEYGSRTLVLMQVGSFYEVYGYKNITTGKIWGSNIEHFKTICDFKVSEKTGTNGIPDNNVLMMAGFPETQIEKYIDRLQSKNYTIAVYKQDKVGKSTRNLEMICSPGTYFSTSNEHSDSITNYITSIRFFVREKSRFNSERRMIIGIASVDIMTGETKYNEHSVPYMHNPSTYDFVERYLSIDRPSEIILLYDSSNISTTTLDEIIQFIGITEVYKHKIDMQSSNPNDFVEKAHKCEKQCVQYEIMQHYFHPHDINTFMASLEFDVFTIACHSMCFLLEFINVHNHNLVEKLRHPNKEYRREHLYLANHSLKQLNIISDERYSGKKGSVLSFMNRCVTTMGKRYFKEQLLHPITDTEILKKRYDAIEYIQECNNDHDNTNIEYIHNIRNNVLHELIDIDKFMRSIVLKNSKISNIIDLISTLRRIYSAYSDPVYKKSFNMNMIDPLVLQENILFCMEYLERIFNVHYDKITYDHQTDDIENGKLYTYSFFNRGIFKDIDHIVDEWVETVEQLHAIRDTLSDIIKDNSSTKRKQTQKQGQSYCKIHHMEKNGYYLRMTNSRAEILKRYFKNQEKIVITYNSIYDKKQKSLDLYLGTDVHFSVATSGDKKLSTAYIDSLTIRCKTMRDKCTVLLQTRLLEIMEDIKTKLFEQLEYISRSISVYDFVVANAQHALQYHYCKPEIVQDIEVDKDNVQSFIDAGEIRHPLIEVLLSQDTYVANDIRIGTEKTKGLLLYGTNAVGKSSYIKSIGIAIILAQAGCFVPCTYFRYKPYHKLFTRILGNDNLFKGLSTFAVEMSELKTILNYSDKNSLVLGDELCSGTETGSAISLFVSGLMELNRLEASYLFATHFHEITMMKEIKEILSLQIKHLSVQYCPERDILIYDRMLKDGPGNNLYGLEVCKSLHLPKQFLEVATNIRHKLYEVERGISERDSSRYNAKKIKVNCELCGNIPEEIHHLKPQKKADAKGFIGNMHKNNIGNLISLCSECHDAIHKDNVDLKKYKTNKGYTIEKSAL